MMSLILTLVKKASLLHPNLNLEMKFENELDKDNYDDHLNNFKMHEFTPFTPHLKKLSIVLHDYRYEL